MTNISERVKGIIAKHLGIDRDKVTEDANFIDDLGADSLDIVELAMSLEDEFNCEIPDEAAESMLSRLPIYALRMKISKLIPSMAFSGRVLYDD